MDERGTIVVREVEGCKGVRVCKGGRKEGRKGGKKEGRKLAENPPKLISDHPLHS